MGKDCTDDMITSSANQQMKHLSQLMKRAKERKKEQVFVVEGIKMFQEAPADTVVSVYVSESFLEKPEHEKCLQGYRYDVGYGICACVGHEDSAGNPCRRTPDGVYGGRYFRGDSACARS